MRIRQLFSAKLKFLSFLITILLFLTSCGDSPSSSESEDLGVISLTNISDGDILSGEVEMKITTDTDEELDEVRVKLRGELIGSMSPNQNIFSFTSWEFSNGDAEIVLEGFTTDGKVISSTTLVTLENYLIRWETGSFISDRLEDDGELFIIASRQNGDVISIIELTDKLDGSVGIGAPEEFNYEVPDFVDLTILKYANIASGLDIVWVDTFIKNEVWDVITQESINAIGNQSKYKLSGESHFNNNGFLVDNKLSANRPNFQQSSESAKTFTIRMENIKSSRYDEFMIYQGRTEVAYTNYSNDYFSVDKALDEIYNYEFEVELYSDTKEFFIQYASRNTSLEDRFGYFYIDSIDFDVDSLITIDFGTDKIPALFGAVDIPANTTTQRSDRRIKFGNNGIVYGLSRYHDRSNENRYYYPEGSEIISHQVGFKNELVDDTYYDHILAGQTVTVFDKLDVTYGIINFDKLDFEIYSEGSHKISSLNFSKIGNAEAFQWLVYLPSDVEVFSFPKIEDHIRNYISTYSWKDLDFRNLFYWNPYDLDSERDIFRYYMKDSYGIAIKNSGTRMHHMNPLSN